jgi:uncharacterized protein Yka (UPF0111/DUF47 family)
MTRHWFLPQTPDVLATLTQQADVTLEGISAFAAWAAGDAAQAAHVRDCEHRADVVRRALSQQLRQAFSTALDPEDLFTLSERLDAVLNGAKNVVRESQAAEILPDSSVARMAEEIRSGVDHIARAFALLPTDTDAATAEADLALSAERHLEKIYRTAMHDLRGQDDPREAMFSHDIYRRCLEVGEALARVADRVWYAVVKEG